MLAYVFFFLLPYDFPPHPKLWAARNGTLQQLLTDGYTFFAVTVGTDYCGVGSNNSCLERFTHFNAIIENIETPLHEIFLPVVDFSSDSFMLVTAFAPQYYSLLRL